MLKVWRPITGQFEGLFLDQGLNGKGAKIRELIEHKLEEILPDEEVEERGLDQKSKIKEFITFCFHF